MNKEANSQKKQIKLFSSKADVVATIIMVLFFLILIVSPKIYLVRTAKWTDWNEKNKNMVVTAMGKDSTEERFRLYFQYYNVIHELGHGLIRYNNGVDIPIADEEQLVNDFAVAYWNYYGTPEKIEELYDIVSYAVENIGDNAKSGVDYMELARQNSDGDDFDASFFNFNDYGWFQFSSVKHSIEQNKSLEEVLHEMGIVDFKLPEKKILEHKVINEEESTAIIEEAVKNFHEWGLSYPEAYQSFKNNPNSNYSSPSKNFLGIFNLLCPYHSDSN